jgi:K(+)-stimulated pyrophosphate-energized sodium pump
MSLLSISVLSGIVSITTAVLLFMNLRKAKIRTEKMAEIAGAIATGVRAYLSRQLKSILLLTPFLAVILWYWLGLPIAVTFVLGVLTSLATAFLGMNAAVRANVKTAGDASDSATKAFHTAVFGGAVMGFSVTGFSLIVLSFLYWILRDPDLLVGFGFGASLAALFAQIGGGIFTKSADVGADLVGKIEQNIPEDDPRNPAVIADQVGDNVGDCAGRGSDLFQTFSDDIVTGMLVALVYAPQYGPLVIFFPLLLQSVGVLSSLVGVFSIKQFKGRQPESAFNMGLLVTTVLATVGSLVFCHFLLHDLSIWWGVFLGILVTLVASISTRYYAGSNSGPVKEIAAASERGVALNIITGLAYGLQSPLASVVMIIIAVSLAYRISGNSLLAIVGVNIGTDLLIGYIMTADAYGPIMDNASGVRSLSSLDTVGNTMKASTKAYAMSSGTVTAFVLFATFFRLVNLETMNVTAPFAIAFLFLGIALPYLIGSLTIGAVARTAQQMVDEVRRQFATIPGLLEGTGKPDYAACVDIATKNALREMILPGIISVFVPVVVGLGFGAAALGPLLIGAVTSAAMLGPFFNNVGTAWDNAKKIIEEHGQKGSPAHQAAVAADTIGDPLKDVAGPSLLIFMKLIGMAALLIAGSLR